MLSPVFESELDDLLAAWRRHNDLRRSKVSIAELARARHVLDDRRQKTYRIRRALNPEPAEASEALATTYCASLDETVFLFATDALWTQPATFECLCGRRVTPERTASRDEV